jgi:predicted nuclease of predicted toxin-antitoxin system
LRNAGHDVLCVSEVAPGAHDEDVLRLANIESRVVLTNDKDFGELIYREGRVSAGLLVLRLETQAGRKKGELLAEVLRAVADRLPGHFSVLTEERLRVRPLRRK